MRSRSVHWRSPLAVTLILIVFVAAASFLVTARINGVEEQASFERLASEADEFARNVETTMNADRLQLELIAEMAGSYMDSDLNELLSFISGYHGTGTFFSRLELLLPGDTVMTPDGTEVNVAGRMSFEDEAALGEHVSDREYDLDGDGYVVRHFVPIEFDGEVAAMLYGVIELDALNRDLPYSPYGGEASVYVIDGATGNYLLDTWHGTVEGNIWSTEPRPLAAGYEHSQLRAGLINGESNYVVFISNTTGEYLYFYYTPLSVNQWRVALSVPEDVVFSGSRSIRATLNVLLVCEAAAFLLYLLWLIRYVRRETGEKQRQLDALNYIYDVEKLLFNAHEHRENIPRALEVIARMLPAGRVTFTMFSSDGTGAGYIWDGGSEAAFSDRLLANAEALADHFASGHAELSLTDPRAVHELLPNAPEETPDLAAVPVEDADGTIRGILTASRLTRVEGCAALLKSVAFSFAKLCGNARTYQDMRRRGERDALTGLFNRNRYEQDLPRIAAVCKTGLGCVYADANGLHELNNSRGHEAGDGMLRTIARELRTRFGDRYTYRIGGDEFVAFVPDGQEDELGRQCRGMVAALESCGYFISAGFARQAAPVSDTDGLVKTAEKRMYEDKRAYYRDPANDRRDRSREYDI